MALSAQHVTKQYIRKRRDGSNVFRAVDDASLDLPDGRITVITGPSGSGKSTLLSMMAGILTPTEGKILAAGADLYSMDDENRSAFRNLHIGVVPQGQTAIYSLNVMENVLLPYDFFRGRRKAETREKARDARARAEELLKRTGILELADTMPSELSGGELRRVAVARAMLMRPDVILADEPTADLDEENTAAVLELMRYAAKEEGSAVMIVTHDRDVFSWADQVFSLRDGRISGPG